MVKESVITAYGISAAICVLLPLSVLVYFSVKKQKIVAPFVLGAVAFFVSQIVLRIPLIQIILPKISGYTAFFTDNFALYALFLGVTAALFEETARFIIVKFALRRRRRWVDAMAFGAGHAGIEAVIIVGAACVTNIVYCTAINNGTFSELVQGISPEMAEYIYSQCIALTARDGMLAGIERISAFGAHIGFTMLVFVGVNKKQKRYYWLAVLLHTVLDAGVTLLQGSVGIIAIEIIVGIFGTAMLMYAVYAKKGYELPDALLSREELRLEKTIAPVIVTALFSLYLLTISTIILLSEVGNIEKLTAALPLAGVAVMIFVFRERIKEIRSGEEDDISNY